MLLHHARTPPEPPSRVSELPIPRAIDEIVVRCLAKNPDDRPASARDLEADLAAVAFDRPWTQERAREWWELHMPGIRAGRE
jgi:serine/threonine protein kinase